MICPHCHQPIALASALSDAEEAALHSKSTATEVQEARTIAALKEAGSAGITTDDLRRLGVYQTSARIWGLRQRGYVISTDLFDGYGADGFRHARMARYRLVSEPLALEQGKRKQRKGETCETPA
jgi:hypothetical protein